MQEYFLFAATLLLFTCLAFLYRSSRQEYKYSPIPSNEDPEDWADDPEDWADDEWTIEDKVQVTGSDRDRVESPRV